MTDNGTWFDEYDYAYTLAPSHDLSAAAHDLDAVIDDPAATPEQVAAAEASYAEAETVYREACAAEQAAREAGDSPAYVTDYHAGPDRAEANRAEPEAGS